MIGCPGNRAAAREKHLVVKCLTCGTLKRFLAREGYQLWSERGQGVEGHSGSENGGVATTSAVDEVEGTLLTLDSAEAISLLMTFPHLHQMKKPGC